MDPENKSNGVYIHGHAWMGRSNFITCALLVFAWGDRWYISVVIAFNLAQLLLLFRDGSIEIFSVINTHTLTMKQIITKQFQNITCIVSQYSPIALRYTRAKINSLSSMLFWTLLHKPDRCLHVYPQISVKYAGKKPL